MKIFDNDPTQDEMVGALLRFLGSMRLERRRPLHQRLPLENPRGRRCCWFVDVLSHRYPGLALFWVAEGYINTG